MRQYYASDKKRREEAKRKQQEAKRLKRFNKTAKNSAQTETENGGVVNQENDPTVNSD